MIGDRDHVEAAGLAVQVDQLADAQPPVAPGRMRVKVAQEKRPYPGISASDVLVDEILGPMVDGLHQKLRTYSRNTFPRPSAL